MHRLRRVLQRLRRRRMESGLSRTGCAQPRLDAGQGRARRGEDRAPARGRRRCRLPCLPHPHELHRALPDADFPDCRHRRPETRSRNSRAAGQALNAQKETLLWVAQRASAAVLAVCVLVHLVTIIYAVRGGLSAAEILGRTRGNVAWFTFYSIFVLGVAVHAPIGLRSVFIEWLGWRGVWRDVALLLFSFVLLVMGMRAVLALFA